VAFPGRNGYMRAPARTTAGAKRYSRVLTVKRVP